MQTLTVTAVKLLDGKTIPLSHVLQISVLSSLASPAQSLYVESVVDNFPGELGEICVTCDAQTVFCGQVDRQVSSLSSRGRILTIEARSKGAFLLDNEAVPCTMTNVNISAVFSRFIAPYRFLLYHPSPGRTLPAYTVHKGVSEWEALTGYTLRVYGRTPYVIGDQVMLDRPRSAVPLSVGGAGAPYQEIAHTHFPYRIVSKVVLRDIDGYYRSAVNNSAAADYGIQRKRYVIPASEFIDSPGLDANQRIRRSMLEKESVRITLPGIVMAHIGQEVEIADPNFRLYNLMVYECAWKQSAKGIVTILTLMSTIYYD